MTQNNEVEMILEGSRRGLVGDAFLSFGWMTQANYEEDRQRTGDGQNNGNTSQYGNKTVCVGCTERILVVYFVVPLSLYTV